MTTDPRRKMIWWSIRSDIGLLGTGWLCTQQDSRWNEGVAHWPIMFITRARARQEARALNQKYVQHGWKFHPVRLVVTYETHQEGDAR